MDLTTVPTDGAARVPTDATSGPSPILSPDSPAGPPTPLRQAREAFRLELTRRRTALGLSKKELARRMAFDPSYVSHIESGRHRPTEDFARRADEVLKSEGRLWMLWRAYDRARHHIPGGEPVEVSIPAARVDPHSDLVVEREEALMRFDGEKYLITIRRLLHSAGTKPVALYWIKIAVDDNPVRPLSWDMLNLTATCNGAPMNWRVAVDQPTVKQVWLLFKNDAYEFPLYPGEHTWIEYSYTVTKGTWGHWFQRAIRLPTRQLAVRLRFPAALRPRVWGTETSMTADGRPLEVAPVITQHPGDEVEWSWDIPGPPLNARYRLQWQFSRALPVPAASEHTELPERGARHRSALNRRRPAAVK